MDIYDQLIQAENKLQQMLADGKIQIGESEAKLKEAAKTMRGEDLKKLEDTHQAVVNSRTKRVEQAETLIAELQEKLGGPERVQKLKQARVELDALRDRARESWLDNGGSGDDFTEAWPVMRRSILVQKTFESLGLPLGNN